ncbi:rhodanese-like domain-containing protein [Kaustia mangrovi]|uniref:Rhodanese-like domain-containing protein n=1 Tax=Kaustia mangrovi TaxID=2593653 RepID=A0A7S8C112_9HYPH|nr:rhodanese-like domain-containing protein [Kaustia mangrovi]QPC41418.1 rhodanese-like domain-containing protein [Kaustia mangrovi]
MTSGSYKGDVSPREAFERLQENDRSVLIDVRTDAEWAFVGVPAVERMARIPWQVFPTMERNEGFVDQVRAAGVPEDAEVFLLCRSGGRSAAAAAALTAAGFENCFNVAGGFEGDRDQHGHRNTVGGWRHDGLPWVQG